MTNGEKNTTQHRMTTTHNDNNTDIVATDTHDKWREKHNSQTVNVSTHQISQYIYK